MLSQAKKGHQEEVQDLLAQESSGPENNFNSQQDCRRRRWLLHCDFSQGEVISSCFK